MSRLSLLFLGAPEIKLNGKSVAISRRKAVALLAYLAVTGQSHTRDTLASLFWPELPQNRARAGLRQVLWQLNNALGKSWIDAAGETLELLTGGALSVDAHRFQALLAEGQTHDHPAAQVCPDCFPLLTEAVKLYRDTFLAGFSLPDNAEFDNWQYMEGEGLRKKASDALGKITDYLIESADFAAAIPYAQRWSRLDPLHDAPHYRLMRLYLRADQRSAAVHQYQQYAQMLKQQLGMEPHEDLQTLYRRIQRGKGQQKPRQTSGRQKSSPVTATASLQTDESPSAAPLAEQGEIRLTTVLVAGMNQAPRADWQTRPEQMVEDTQNLLQIVTQVVTRYEGQVVHFDGYRVQAIFGMLQAHEDDPERAIRAALQIQDAAQAQGIDLTVGIDTGHIYLGPLRTPKFQEVATLGPVVRLASRLQDNAAPGQIIVSDSTHLFTRRVFQFAPYLPGGHSGERPYDAYEVKKALSYPEKMRGIRGLRATLIGRDEELQKLKTAFAAVLSGQGQLASLVGEAGLGKSRLIEELKQVILTTTPDDSAAPLWLESRCLSLRTSTGFWPFIDLLQRYLYTAFGASTEADRLQALHNCLETMHRQGRFDGNETRSKEIKALLSNMLTLKVESEWRGWLRGLDSQTVQAQTFRAVQDFITALAVDRPVILVFEDMHWIDDLSFDLITCLMDMLRSNPILMVCVYRPHYQHTDLRFSALASRKCPGRYVSLTLQELTPEQSLRFTRSLLALDQLPPALEQLMLEQTQGVPFFMEEVVRELIENDLLYAEEDESSHNARWQMRGEVAVPTAVPKSIQSVILSRIDRLAPEPKQLLRSAAVIGYNFQTQILSQITPQLSDFRQALWQLEESALIYREKVVTREEYVFKHILIQESVYQTVPPEQKATLHRRAAEAIERNFAGNLSEQYEQLAYHYKRGKATEKAIQYLCLAGEKSRQIFLNKEAIRYFTGALEQIEEPCQDPAQQRNRDQWQRLALTGLGRTYHRLGKEVKAEQYLQRAIALGEETGADTPTLIRLYHWLGEVYFWQAQYGEREKLGQKGLKLLSSADSESVEAALVYQLLAMSALHMGDTDQFHYWTTKTAQFIQNLPYREELKPAYIHIAISSYYRKRPDEAEQWLRTVAKWAENHNDQSTLAELYQMQWSFDIEMGDLHTAVTQVDQIIKLYREVGHERRMWNSLQDIIWIYIHLGNFTAAERYARRGLELAESLQRDKYRTLSLLYEGLVKLCQGNWANASDILQKITQSTSDIDWRIEWIAYYCLGQCHRLQANPEAALSHFQAAMRSFRSLYLPIAGWSNSWPHFAGLLTGLEATYEALHGDKAAYEAYCRQYELATEPSFHMPLPKQWLLEAVPDDDMQRTDPPSLFDSFTGELGDDWTWRDPFADCTYSVRSGLQIEAANGRDLWHLNLSAPRLLRPVAGDFVAQTICKPSDSCSQNPAIGGLLLWRDEFNFVRLVWGKGGERELSYEGCIDNQTLIIGRGLLPQNPSQFRAFLRLRRRADVVEAFGSANGTNWFSLGQIEFSVAHPLQVGLHAVGSIDRLIYPAAYPDGTAVHFQSFSLWM